MQRVLFQDVVPYDAPCALARLRGPEHGVLVVPKSVYWGPTRQFDLGEHADRVSAYQAIIREGSRAQQESDTPTPVAVDDQRGAVPVGTLALTP